MSKKLIVIGGPTASGKTALAIDIAQHLNTQILSADSRQCYHELNIGVAKPSQAELNAVPHFFINSHSIHDDVTAGGYERYGLTVLRDIFSKSDIAVCVGGTGLYIKALCEGMDEMPLIDKSVKNEVEQEFEAKGVKWLQSELQVLDPSFLEQTDTSNYMRLLRALIFYRSHGVSILKYLGKPKKQRDFSIDYYAVGIDRKKLYVQINKRVDFMMNNGLIQEVENLQDFKQIKALQTVGYKELFAYLDGRWSKEKAIEKIKQHTRNYAKRQITWFKNQGDYLILSPESILKEVLN